jgi:hypothetical protein
VAENFVAESNPIQILAKEAAQDISLRDFSLNLKCKKRLYV